MIPKITSAKYTEGYKLYLHFSDGSEGEVNLEPELTGEIFEPLKDLSFFKMFSVNHEIHTIVWPNGADFAPEFLREKLKIMA
ncbi:conserved uncharacterized protein, DUF2442 [Desulfosarcina variabilis str. Montpellier]|uniref:DUF2442 domain-containing protein n=1 Tax=Desulfosarcina variabilis TaxID=2300 RepID=UPI003AFAEFF8